MKGQAEAIDVIGIVAVIAILIAIFGVLHQKTLESALAQIISLSAPLVARDLASFITIGTIAPGDMTISNYHPTAKYTYDVTVAKRYVNVHLNLQDEKEKEAYGKPDIVDGSAPILVDISSSDGGVNNFDVSKSWDGTKSSYDIIAACSYVDDNKKLCEG